MSTTAQPNQYKAFVLEPITFAVSQPGQVLISAASVAIVAAEAATIVPIPFNGLLALGAEWVYLRGLISGNAVKSRWAAALNISAVFLVASYGALWSFRKFGAIPEVPPIWAAVVLTLIHIGAISAVTLCSAMLHRAGERVKHLEAQKVAEEENERNRRNQQLEDARNQQWRDAQLTIEIEKQRQQAELQAEAERLRLRREARAAARVATNPAVARNQTRNQSIIYNDVEYPSIQAAADAHGITRQAMSKRLRQKEQAQ
jgi:uncharacterized protein (DUF697 family)